MRGIVRAIGGDLRQMFIKIYSYLILNAHNTRITPGCYVHPKARLASTCSFFGSSQIYARAKIGHYTYGTNCIITNAHIGKFCSIGPGCIIGPDNHPTNLISTSPKTYQSAVHQPTLKPVIIGDDVWLGGNVIIMPGITVGDGSVVGAGAVVTRNVEPFTIVGGVPARIIGKRHGDTSFIDAIKQTDDPKELWALATQARENTWPVQLT